MLRLQSSALVFASQRVVRYSKWIFFGGGIGPTWNMNSCLESRQERAVFLCVMTLSTSANRLLLQPSGRTVQNLHKFYKKRKTSPPSLKKHFIRCSLVGVFSRQMWWVFFSNSMRACPLIAQNTICLLRFPARLFNKKVLTYFAVSPIGALWLNFFAMY